MNQPFACMAITALMAGIVYADAPSNSLDARLSAGTLSGQVVNQSGHSLRLVEIHLYSAHGQLLRSTSADAQGSFQLEAIRPGVYQISAATNPCERMGSRMGARMGARTQLRVWRAELAPPHAVDAVLLAIGPTTRGQLGRTPSTGPIRHGASKVANHLGGAGGVGVAIVGATIATVVIASDSNSPGS